MYIKKNAYFKCMTTKLLKRREIFVVLINYMCFFYPYIYIYIYIYIMEICISVYAMPGK